MTTRHGLLVAGVTGLVLSLTAACSNDDARPVTATETPTATASDGSAPTDTGGPWTETTDRASGVRFALPGRPSPVTSQRPGPGGTAVSSTQYVADDGDIQVSVNLLTTPDRPARVRRVVRVEYVPFLVVNGLQGSVEDAGVVANKRLRGVPYRAFDSELTYVRSGRRTLWLTRAVALEDAVVLAQAIVRAPDDEDARPRVRAVFQRLTDGLVLPD